MTFTVGAHDARIPEHVSRLRGCAGRGPGWLRPISVPARHLAAPLLLSGSSQSFSPKCIRRSRSLYYSVRMGRDILIAGYFGFSGSLAGVRADATDLTPRRGGTGDMSGQGR